MPSRLGWAVRVRLRVRWRGDAEVDDFAVSEAPVADARGPLDGGTIRRRCAVDTGGPLDARAADGPAADLFVDLPLADGPSPDLPLVETSRPRTGRPRTCPPQISRPGRAAPRSSGSDAPAVDLATVDRFVADAVPPLDQSVPDVAADVWSPADSAPADTGWPPDALVADVTPTADAGGYPYCTLTCGVYDDCCGCDPKDPRTEPPPPAPTRAAGTTPTARRPRSRPCPTASRTAVTTSAR